MRRCGESAVSIASMPLVLPPMYWAAANLSTAPWKVASSALAVSNAAWSAACFASASCCAASLLFRSSCAECIASVVRSAFRDSSFSFANASSAGSACTLPARIPPNRVSADIAYITGRLTARVIRCVRSSVKICVLKLPLASRPETVLGLRQVTKRHQPCPNKRRKFNRLSEFFGLHLLLGVSSGDNSRITMPVNRHQPQPRCQTGLREHLERGTLVVAQGVRNAEQHAHHAVLASGATHSAVIAIDGDRAGIGAPLIGLVHLTVLSLELVAR